ncbi:MAG: hypothetical protein K2Y29_12655 [Beijerinckiaceae bacterium]|nr:hypothetical protein [Beijerinckiaceae bacterium]
MKPLRSKPTRIAAIAAAMLACAASGALAQGAAVPPAAGQPAERDGRYTMTPAPDGGFLRLDTRTGAVSHCRTAEGSVQCRASADERAALQAEIDRLAKENEDLRKKTAQAGPGDRLRNALPNDEEVNKALSWMEQLMRRIMRVLRDDPTQDRI